MSSNKLICRSCKGDHLTIKCPNKIKKEKTLISSNKKYDNKYDNSTKGLMVRIKPLPNDLNKFELVELLKNWGPIGKIILKKDYRNKSQIAMVEFIKKDNALKAIYQLNETPFDYIIINVSKI